MVIGFYRRELKGQQANDPDFAKQFMLFSLRERYFDHTDRNRIMREKTINCCWNILEAPADGPFFITTDNPSAAIGISDQKFHTIKLEGGFIFYFPLLPQFCLVFSDTDKDWSHRNNELTKPIRHIAAEPAAVIRINDVLINVASKMLIASDKSYLAAITEINRPKT